MSGRRQVIDIQLKFQYCDVHVPKIQEMLDKIPTPLSGAICNEKTGWLPPNFDDNCREILTETINELLEQQPADFNPNALASTSRATLQNSQQAQNEWEYGVSGGFSYFYFVSFMNLMKMDDNLHHANSWQF